MVSDMRNYLIFAQRTNIRKISLDVDYFADITLPISSLKNAIAVSVDRVEGSSFSVLIAKGKLQCFAKWSILYSFWQVNHFIFIMAGEVLYI